MKRLLTIFTLIFTMLTVNAQAKDGKSVYDYETKISEIVTKAKTEGANWSVDEWKAQTKTLLKTIKPIFDEMVELREKYQKAAGDTEKMAVAKEAQEKQKKYEKTMSLILEYNEAINATVNGQIVKKDDAWFVKTAQDVGIDPYFFKSIK